MNIILEEKSETKKILKVSISSEIITKETKAICLDLAKNVTIPGFRQGKAPQAMLEKRFKTDIENEILRKVVPEAYMKAIKDNSLNPISDPELMDVNFENGSLSFNATIFVAPSIKLPAYKDIKITKTKTSLDENEIDNVLKDMQERSAEFNILEVDKLAMGHCAVIDYEGKHEGTVFESKKDTLFMVTKDNFIKDFSAQICGMKKGEEKEVEVTLPENYTDSKLAGKKVTFKVTLKEIKEKKLPELNDEFAKKMGQIKTLAELKDKIRENMQQMRDSMENHALQDQALNQLLENTSFELPDNLLENEKKQLLTEQKGKQLDDKAKEEIQAKAEKRIKTFFLLNEIIKNEKIEAKEEDLNKKYAQMAAQFGGTIDQVKGFYKGERLEDLKHQVQQENALNFLIENATVKEK